MNFKIEADCTPEEARRFMGLPDLASVHEVYLAKMRTAIEQAGTPDGIQAMLQAWGPMGEAMATWRRMLEQAGNAASHD